MKCHDPANHVSLLGVTEVRDNILADGSDGFLFKVTEPLKSDAGPGDPFITDDRLSRAGALSRQQEQVTITFQGQTTALTITNL